MTANPTRFEDVVPLLEESTQSPEGTIAADQALLDLEGWDSMGMVMFLGLVEERFGVELSIHDLRECATAADLGARVAAKVAEG